MAYYSSYQAQPQSASKVPTFVTKAPHDVVLTQLDSRIFVKNIKNGVTLAQFKKSMEVYGAVQVYLYEPGTQNNGWAWVGFEDKEAAIRAVKDAERAEEEKKMNRDVSRSASYNARNPDDKEEAQSFYADNDEHQANEEQDVPEEPEFNEDQDE